MRASVNHPNIDLAIDQVIAELGRPDVIKGFSPEARNCADFADNLGHLTEPVGYSAAAIAIGNYYGRSQ